MAAKKSGKNKVSDSAKRKTRLTIILLLIAVGLFALKGVLVVGSKKADEQQVKTPITNLASSNANAGLTIIASAIKKYHAEKNKYPDKLIDLYPDYITEKNMLTDISWRYRTEGSDYYCIERVIERNGTNYMYRIDPRMEVTKTVMGNQTTPVKVAQKTDNTAGTVPATQKSLEELDIDTEQVDLASWVRETRAAKTKENNVELDLALQIPKAEESDEVEKNGADKVSVLFSKINEEILPSDVKEMSDDLRVSSFLIWLSKGKKSTQAEDEKEAGIADTENDQDNSVSLCFSNVQYPQMTEVTAICTDKEWLAPGGQD